ncbi:AraC family transcriptional regulator [Nocardioides sp. AN3]
MMISRAHRTQSVSFIASQLGFSTLQVFSRAFTAKYGVGPRRYRLEHA